MIHPWLLIASTPWQFNEHVNITAVMLFIALASPGFLAIKAAISARNSVHKAHEEGIKSARVTIESEHVVPNLAALSSDVHFRSGEAVRNSVNEVYEAMQTGEQRFLDEALDHLRSHVEDALQDSRLRSRLTQLRDAFFDHRQLDELRESSISSARNKGWASGVAVIGIFLFLSPTMFLDVELQTYWLLLGAVIGAVGAITGIMSWLQERRALNRLALLIEKYG